MTSDSDVNVDTEGPIGGDGTATANLHGSEAFWPDGARDMLSVSEAGHVVWAREIGSAARTACARGVGSLYKTIPRHARYAIRWLSVC